MPVLADLFPLADLQAELEAGYVLRKQHPELPLSLYVYSRACQYENRWNQVTTRCRGLVVDDLTGQVVGWCLPKFFNHSQHGVGYDFAPPLPDEPFDVFDKVDGSLGIVFHYLGSWHVASKGSFVSEQAKWAQDWLGRAQPYGLLTPGHTYLAEIVYPENRIVVNNGDLRTLVLLAVYNEHGVECDLEEYRYRWQACGGRVVRSWPRLPLAQLVKLAAENTKLDGAAATGTDAEGWVVRFASGLRVKTKLAEYVRLHKTLTGTNARDIWRYLGADIFGATLTTKDLGQTLGCAPAEAAQLAALNGRALASLLEQVPDEFDEWARGVEADLSVRFDAYLKQVTTQFEAIRDTPGGRAGFAQAAQAVEDRTVRAGLFRLLDGRSVDVLIWKAIRPEPSDPFRTDEEG